MTDQNYRKAQAALDEADALIAQTEAMLAEAEFEAAFAEGEQMLSEIDRAIDTLNRLCDSEDFSEKIEAEFPTLTAKSTEELTQLQKRQSAVAEKLQDRLLKKQEAYADACEAVYGDGENVSEEAAALKKKLATLKKKLSATQQNYHRAKKNCECGKNHPFRPCAFSGDGTSAGFRPGKQTESGNSPALQRGCDSQRKVR